MTQGVGQSLCCRVKKCRGERGRRRLCVIRAQNGRELEPSKLSAWTWMGRSRRVESSCHAQQRQQRSKHAEHVFSSFRQLKWKRHRTKHVHVTSGYRSGPSSPSLSQRSYERVAARDRNAVLSAIDSLGNRVTIGDVSQKSGLDIAIVEEVMRDIAADADGFSLEVSDAGDLVYVKPSGSIRAALASKSMLLRMEPFIGKTAVRCLCRNSDRSYKFSLII